MITYSKGNVVLVYYPYWQDGKIVTKIRPAIILEISGSDHFVVKCTSKNKSDRFKGIWVLSSSAEGVQMGFLKNTFINLTETITLKRFGIIRKIGDCPIMDQIEEMLDID